MSGTGPRTALLARGGARAATLAVPLLAVAAVLLGLSRWLGFGAGLRHHLPQAFPLVTAALVGGVILGALALARAARRPRPGLGDLVIAACAAAAAPVGYLAVFEDFREPYVAAAVGLAAGSAALLLVLRSRFGGAWRRARPLRVLAVSALACLLAAELGLRAYARLFPGPLLLAGTSVSRDRIAAQRFTPGGRIFGFSVNSRGDFDHEPLSAPAHRRVVSVSDSFAIAAVPHPLHFTTVCERELPWLDVYNMGTPSIEPPEYLHLIVHEALPLRPDAIVVHLFVGNDLTFRREPESGGWARSYFERRRVLLLRLLQRQHRLREERRRAPEEGLRMAALDVPADGKPIETVSDALAAFPWTGDPMLEQPAISQERFLLLETQRARETCATDGPGFEDLYQCVDEMIRAAGETPIYFTLIPDEFQVEEDLWREVSERAGVPLERDRPQRVVGAWFEARGLPLLDLLPAMLAAPPLADGRRHLYHLRDTHWNARGCAVAGRALAEFLAQRIDRPR